MGTMDEKNSLPNTMTGSLRSLWRNLWVAISIAIVPIILLYVFGFSIKTTPEYDCAMQMVEKSRQVIQVTGSPIKPGQFAWTKFFESGGMLRQGAFFTSISGPAGSGRIDVNFYRAPVGESLAIWFTSKGVETKIFDDGYPCAE
jgi:predicted ferric reductase